jgi:hypothetical protein
VDVDEPGRDVEARDVEIEGGAGARQVADARDRRLEVSDSYEQATRVLLQNVVKDHDAAAIPELVAVAFADCLLG